MLADHMKTVGHDELNILRGLGAQRWAEVVIGNGYLIFKLGCFLACAPSRFLYGSSASCDAMIVLLAKMK